MLAQFVREIAAREAQTPSDFSLHAAGHFERPLNYRFFERGKKFAKIVCFGHHLGELLGSRLGAIVVTRPVGLSCHWYWAGFQRDFLFGGQDTRPLNQVTKFGDIPGKVIGQQCPHCIGGDFTRPGLQVLRDLPQEESAKLRYVFTLLAQGRNRQRNHREPVVKVLAKAAFLNSLF
jgi:hypothetical protein